MSSPARPTKYVFVTGGVVSALGKGIVAASLGRLLKARGLSVQLQKFDPYLNVDPGTMSPFQHGEVFVTEDGAETDLDIGHYERFVHEIRDKIALFADVDPAGVVACPDVPDVYLVPSVLKEEGLDRLVCARLGIDASEPDLAEWDELVERI